MNLAGQFGFAGFMMAYKIAGVIMIRFKAMLNRAYLAFGWLCTPLDHDLIVDAVIDRSVSHFIIIIVYVIPIIIRLCCYLSSLDLLQPR